MMKNEMTTWTSPHTGRVYNVEIEPQSRVDYHEFMNPDTKFVRHYNQYNFFYEGKLVTFTFDLDENRLGDTFAVIEGVYAAPFSSKFD
jgi:hypothetical protein